MKIKNFFLIVLSITILSILSGCKVQEKKFSSHGITIMLTNQFKKQHDENVQVFLVAKKYGFMGNAENKAFTGVNNNELEHYTRLVLKNSNKEAEIFTFGNDEEKFCYAYYTAKVGIVSYKYMLVTKEGLADYYTMNFWSKEANFDKYETQFFEWAKTIRVE